MRERKILELGLEGRTGVWWAEEGKDGIFRKPQVTGDGQQEAGADGRGPWWTG